MPWRVPLLSSVYLLLAALPAFAQSSLPIVEDVDNRLLQRQVAQLRDCLGERLRAQDRATLERLAAAKDPTRADLAEEVQRILDPYCLVGVTINPESRVKAARGPRAANLVRGRETLVLIKLQNDAGTTQALKVSGDQLRNADGGERTRWLEAGIYTKKPLATKLSGQKLEYVVLRLKAHEVGKREATLKFDVGQGTQDLGFRAEVPILFTIKTN